MQTKFCMHLDKHSAMKQGSSLARFECQLGGQPQTSIHNTVCRYNRWLSEVSHCEAGLRGRRGSEVILLVS